MVATGSKCYDTREQTMENWNRSKSRPTLDMTLSTLGTFLPMCSFQGDQIKAEWAMVMIKENKGRKGEINFIFSSSYLSVDKW